MLFANKENKLYCHYISAWYLLNMYVATVQFVDSTKTYRKTTEGMQQAINLQIALQFKAMHGIACYLPKIGQISPLCFQCAKIFFFPLKRLTIYAVMIIVMSNRITQWEITK